MQERAYPPGPPILDEASMAAHNAHVELMGQLARNRQLEESQALWTKSPEEIRFHQAITALGSLPFCRTGEQVVALIGPVVATSDTFEQVYLTTNHEPLIDQQDYHPLNRLRHRSLQEQAAGIVLYACMLPSSGLNVKQIEQVIEEYGRDKAERLVADMQHRLYSEKQSLGWTAVKRYLTDKDRQPLRSYLKEEKQAVKLLRWQVNDMHWDYFGLGYKWRHWRERRREN